MKKETLPHFRLTLRQVRLTDAKALADMLCPEISCWLAEWPDRIDPVAAAGKIAAELEAADTGGSLPLVVEIACSCNAPVVAGWFRLRLASHDPALALMTCWIGRAYQGRGIARSAVLAAMPLASDYLGARRVGAYVMRSNAPSIRVLAESGLRYDGERTVEVPARGRTEIVFAYERELEAFRKAA